MARLFKRLYERKAYDKEKENNEKNIKNLKPEDQVMEAIKKLKTAMMIKYREHALAQ